MSAPENPAHVELLKAIGNDIHEAFVKHEDEIRALIGPDGCEMDFVVDALIRATAGTVVNFFPYQADAAATAALINYMAMGRRMRAIAEGVHLTPEKMQ